MKIQYPDLVPLGWNKWFEERAAECGPGDTIARVVAVDRDLLLVMDPAGTFRAKTAGSYLFRHHLVQELPCVGDWVCVERDPAGCARFWSEKARCAAGPPETPWTTR